MAKWKKMIYTNAGKKMLASAAAGECQVEFVQAVIGDGIYTKEEQEEQKLCQQIELKNQRNSYGFSSIHAEENTVYLRAALQNTDVQTAYFVNELGVYAREKGSSEEAVLVLIAVAEVPDYFPDQSNGITIIQNIVIDFSDVRQLCIADDMGAYALVNPEYNESQTLERLVSGENLSTALGKLAKAVDDLISLKNQIPFTCVLSTTEPSKNNTLWLYPKNTTMSASELMLGDSAQDAEVQAEVEGTSYAVQNVINTQSSEEAYSYEII